LSEAVKGLKYWAPKGRITIFFRQDPDMGLSVYGDGISPSEARVSVVITQKVVEN
jgi:hypothetical protein